MDHELLVLVHGAHGAEEALDLFAHNLGFARKLGSCAIHIPRCAAVAARRFAHRKKVLSDLGRSL